MNFLTRVQAAANPLAESISEWVERWRPDQLLALYSASPELFKDLPKTKIASLYRLIYLSKKDIESVLGGKTLKGKNVLESWSTNPKLDKVGEGQVEHGKKPGMYAVILKKRVPLKERVVYIPDAHRKIFTSTKLSNDFIKREAEVITHRQTISADDIFSIEDPLTKKKLKPESFLGKVSSHDIWDEKKKQATKLFNSLRAEDSELPSFPEKLGDNFVLEFYSKTSYGIRNTKTNIRQIYNSTSKTWELA